MFIFNTFTHLVINKIDNMVSNVIVEMTNIQQENQDRLQTIHLLTFYSIL